MSTTRIQCQYLERLGYLDRIAVDTYTATSDGEQLLGQDQRFEDGYLDLYAELKLEYDHVTELGELLDAETIIRINKQFFEKAGIDYDGTADSPQDIENVRDSRLERLTAEFPRFEPITNQLAHVVRTFCGTHPFPDANHRTGTHIADILAGKQGFNLFEAIRNDPSGIRRAVETSKILRGLCSNVRESVDYLWLKDELFHHWDRYFRDVLYDLTPQKRVHLKTGECQSGNLPSNEKVSLIYEFAVLDREEMAEVLDK